MWKENPLGTMFSHRYLWRRKLSFSKRRRTCRARSGVLLTSDGPMGGSGGFDGIENGVLRAAHAWDGKFAELVSTGVRTKMVARRLLNHRSIEGTHHTDL